MQAWPTPPVPDVPGLGPQPRLHDTASGVLRPVEPGDEARLYVCGVTPYDTTHLGHAATYIAFDVLHRSLLDAGHDVAYVQNVTDVDEPLLERAARDGVDWTALATDQIALFHADMEALAVIPPRHYVGVVESMEEIAAVVREIDASGHAYLLPVDPNDPQGPADVYLDTLSLGGVGEVTQAGRGELLALSAERGGDPGRAGKRDPLDPLLWRAERPGEPAWDGGSLGRGRPGWHVECTAIARRYLGAPIDVQGGGSDLVFPHHEMSALQSRAIDGGPFARCYAHQGMVALHGEKMSKSKGNLVRVSTLREAGVDPMAVRLAVLAHHYRDDWEWFDSDLDAARARLDRWRSAVALPAGPGAEGCVRAVRAAVAEDLGTPRALAAVDRWVDAALSVGGDDPQAPSLLGRLVDRVLGVRL